MWEAVAANDAQYDGAFYYAVKTTGIVCRPSCRSKVPNRENVVFFTSLDEALHDGFRPCKRCRPDLGAHYRPEEDIVELACRLLRGEYHNPNILAELPERIGISFFHFQRLFKRVTGCTPKEYLQRIRIDKAAELLAHSSLNNTDICLTVGFRSVSGFYTAFRQHMGLPPKKYRKIRERGELRHDCL